MPAGGYPLPRQLQEFSIAGNSINGTLPQEWAGLPESLAALNVSDNLLTGAAAFLLSRPAFPLTPFAWCWRLASGLPAPAVLAVLPAQPAAPWKRAHPPCSPSAPPQAPCLPGM